MSTKPNDTETEQNANMQYCARCGATVEDAEDAHQHVKDEHDGQPTQILDTLDPDEVVGESIEEIDALLENWGQLDEGTKRGKLVLVREFLDSYEIVTELSDNSTEGDDEQ